MANHLFVLLVALVWVGVCVVFELVRWVGTWECWKVHGGLGVLPVPPHKTCRGPAPGGQPGLGGWLFRGSS